MRWFLFWLLMVPLLGQDLEKLTPVTGKLIQGNRLVHKTFRFSIAAPDGWLWYRPTDRRDIFLALSPQGNLYYTIRVDHAYKKAFDGDLINALIEDINIQHAAVNREVTGMRYRSVDIPSSGSLQFTYRTRDEWGLDSHIYTYLTVSDRLYVMQASTDSIYEPGSFTSFAESFRLLKQGPQTAFKDGDTPGATGTPPPLKKAEENQTRDAKAGSKKLPSILAALAVLLGLLGTGFALKLRADREAQACVTGPPPPRFQKPATPAKPPPPQPRAAAPQRTAAPPIPTAQATAKVGGGTLRISRLISRAVVPKSMDQRGLLLEINGAEKRLPYDHIKAIAVGVIRPKDGRTHLLMDLLLDDPYQALEGHRLLRADSSRYSAADLIGETGNQAYRRLTDRLSERASAPIIKAAAHPSEQLYERDTYNL